MRDLTTKATAESGKTYRLEGTITLLAPLSHIGNSIGPDSFLADTVIVGPDNQPVTCFSYSGNAFRGHLRDLGAAYLLDRMGSAKVSLETFHMLFSGGSLGGDQVIDIHQARLFRRVLPLFSIFGGGVGNQLMGGKMNIGAMWPVCVETQRVIPERLRDPDAPRFGQLTSEHSFTRTDDAKDENLRQYLALPAGQETLAIEGDQGAGKTDRPRQMRYTMEVLSTGSRLYQRIDLLDVTDLELGAFVSCLHEFAKAPYIGGMARVGFGLVDAEWTFAVAGEPGGVRPFVTVGEGRYLPGPEAATAKERYDDFLHDLYDRYLEGKAPEIRQALGVGGAADGTA
jgi:CRISPR type IV-associated protein Csf2